ncbi:MAG TPA: SMP-30/gluconolactonase/LRE family protein [Acidobacteriaceae bacterium]|jgi:gluconolactonase|nr:SMP-30/gluconolactonase/LRE family protein [Acidobacteriaceae bacterium]
MILSRIVLHPLLLAAVLAPTSLLSQTKPGAPIERLTPEAAAIIPPAAHLEKIVTCCKWLEGPAWAPDGRLFVSDTDLNEMLVVSSDNKASIFKKPSGLTDPSFHGKEPGTNGNAFDASGRLTVAGHALHQVFRFDKLESSSSLTVLADRYQGKRFNSPNDITYASDGSLFFTDPPYGLASQQDNDPKKELPFNGVFMIRNAAHKAPGSTPTDPVLLIRDLTRPNGIALSPDEKVLYVANSDPANPLWMRYPLEKNGTVGPGKVLLSAKGAPGDGTPDGIKVDVKGNLYGAGPGGVWIISPEGKHIATIHVPERVSNCGWGGPDGQTLYITASSSVYRIHLNSKGLDLTHRH